MAAGLLWEIARRAMEDLARMALDRQADPPPTLLDFDVLHDIAQDDFTLRATLQFLDRVDRLSCRVASRRSYRELGRDFVRPRDIRFHHFQEIFSRAAEDRGMRAARDAMASALCTRNEIDRIVPIEYREISFRDEYIARFEQLETHIRRRHSEGLAWFAIDEAREMTAAEALRMREASRRLEAMAFYGSSVLDFSSIVSVVSINHESEARGMALLREHLTPEQTACYDRHKHFLVVGGETGTTYRIKHGRQMNIDVLAKDGRRLHGICFLPAGNLCTGDTMLAQKHALELCEADALRVANRFA